MYIEAVVFHISDYYKMHSFIEGRLDNFEQNLDAMYRALMYCADCCVVFTDII